MEMKEIFIDEKIKLKMVTHKQNLTVDESIALNLFCSAFEIIPQSEGFYVITITGVEPLNIQTVTNIINL